MPGDLRALLAPESIALVGVSPDAEIIRGEGEAEATRIYADAYRDEGDFYAFQRSLEAYRKTIDGRTTLVLSPDAEFFKYFGSADAQ